MKTASQALIDLLNSNRQFIMADLYTFALASGTVLRYCDYDQDITTSGNTYLATGPTFKRDRVRLVLGLEVDTMQVDIAPRATDAIQGIPWMRAVAAGYLDGGTLRVDRAFMNSPGTVVGTVAMFSGRIAELDIRRSIVNVTVKSDLEVLNTQLPRNLYQAGCMHTLFDARCTLSSAAYAVAGAAQSGSSASVVLSAITQPVSYFDMGYITFTSGALSGTTRTVKTYRDGVFAVLSPLPQGPAIGDTFNAYPGCDKTQAICEQKFNNKANFRGFPFIPPAETAV